MADILPFCGIHYDAASVGGDLAAVVAPPYDVISPAEQQDLYDRHPNNVVRLILGREENKYASADAHFRQWLRDGVLVADQSPSVYIYRQTFKDPMTGAAVPERVGLICLLKLEDYSTGKVLPHENTITAHKADRLELMRATHAQLESIYGTFSDEPAPGRETGPVQALLAKYDAGETVVEQIDNVIGSSHRIDRMTDSDAIATLQSLLRDKPIFIADGHHRYETALNYRREVRAARNVPESETIPEDYILITLTAFEDPGLLVLPTHRLVRNIDDAVINALPEALADRFSVTRIERDKVELAIEDAAKSGRKAFGLVLPGGKTFLSTLDVPIDEIPALIPGSISDAAKRLDVTILQRLVLEGKLGITPEALAAGGKVGYTRDSHEALEAVDNGQYQAAFLLGRPSVDDVRLVSLAGDKMPQKSTFFYPKLLSGLILRDFVGESKC